MCLLDFNTARLNGADALMEIMITLQWNIKIEGNRVNADEIARAVECRLDEAKGPVGQAVLEAYREQIVQILCSPSGSLAKKGLGGHEVKGEPGRSCAYRSFRQAGFWTEDRGLGESHAVPGLAGPVAEWGRDGVGGVACLSA